jgi:serine phosphatase RsbU (regulator of sigma subunit)
MSVGQHLLRIAQRYWPGLGRLEESERDQLISEAVGLLYGALLSLAGLVWLVRATDVSLMRENWPILLLLLCLATLLNQLDFFWIVERRGGAFDRWSAPLSGLVTISAALLFGPAALWLGVGVLVFSFVRFWRGRAIPAHRWSALRGLAIHLSGFVLGSLLGLTLYRALGGALPLPGLIWPDALLAVLAVLTLLAFDWLCWSAYLLIVRWTQLSRTGARELGLFAAGEFVAYVPEFFAILAAAVYVQMGVAAYLILILGALLVALLAQRLSRAVERSGQRSRELAQLEQLGRAIITAPPDGSTLPELLATFVPPMFRAEQIEIRLRAGNVLLHTPEHSTPMISALWEWLASAERSVSVAVGGRPPWADLPTDHGLAAASIVSSDGSKILGGMAIRFSSTIDDPAEALPALQSLVAQIASALYRAEEYARTLAHEKVVQELAMAAEIQASFLPETLPSINGWQLSAVLRPARQTSGDFYDVLELPGGRLGLLIADVTDKGTGAALFMALSRTLIRTYAFEYPDQPALTFHAANKRILRDSRSSMFVTVFYGVLDPAQGTLIYCNAGHNPPFLLSGDAAPLLLRNTGIPLGISLDMSWRPETITIPAGSALVLYTDGISEAQDTAGAFFEVDRLHQAAQSPTAPGAQSIQRSILAAVDQFVGAAPQSDDLTLLVVTRDAEGEPGTKN